MSNNGTNGRDRLEALRQREAALKTAIVAEKVKQQKRREKEHARLCAIVGAICVRDSEESPENKTKLIRAMQGADISEGDRTFLVRMNWL